MNPDVHCAYAELMPIEEVKPNPENPNRHSPEQIELLAGIILEQGWRAPITVSTRSGLVVRGHGRLEAARKLYSTIVPVDLQDYASEELEMADMIADNRIAELAHIDYEQLTHVIRNLSEHTDFDLLLTGYSEDAINSLLAAYADTPIEDLGEDKDVDMDASGDTSGKQATCPQCGFQFDVS